MADRILLLQARQAHDPAKAEERTSFAEKARLPLEAVVSHDLLQGPPSLEEARRYTAVMVGGSGEYFVSRGDLPKMEETLDFFRQVVEVGHPVFASCFGFHIMTAALGGEVVYDPENTEVGTYPLQLTEAGQQDELLGELPTTFMAQLGRKDRATRLPPGAEHLAQSERAPFQAFRLPGRPIWATQFHPELTGEENRLRFSRYLEEYRQVLGPDEALTVLERFKPSPDTPALIHRFLQIIGRRPGCPR